MNAATRLLSGLALSVALALSVHAQSLPGASNIVLVADRVYVTGDSVLTAEGHVEALMDGTRLMATRIVYDSVADKVTLEGPIRIVQGNETTIVASSAELDSEFRNGLMRSARVVLGQQVQLAANQMDRVDGRYNVLTKTSVSSCRVCDTDDPPLWQIRARRVIHDEQERQIYFDHASLLVRDVPVLYFPHLRLPDPTLDRANGFLIPSFRSTSQLSYGFKVPYFITMGNHRDLTLTPYLSSETRTLELRYRQAFKKGRINFYGAISDDTILPNQIRGYVFIDGRFELPRDYTLSFNIKSVTDDSYLTDYDYSDEDRLVSDITARRSKRNENTRFALLHYRSLREDEDNNTLPTLVAVAETERRYYPSAIGGEIRTTLELHAHQRDSDFDMDSGDPDTEVDGRDVGRFNASALWRRNWTMSNGLRTGVTGELSFDAYRTEDDATVSTHESQITPTVAAYLRYPMSKRGADGATYLLEPVAQIGWTGGSDLDIANDESTRVEFDEGNLLALSRFPSYDRRERGVTGAVGLNWARHSTDSWQGNLTIGQVYHQEAQADFTDSSGLSDTVSDFLIAGQYRTQNGLELVGRTLFDPNEGLNKASARVGWSNTDLWLDASYVWLGPDLAEDRPDTVSEIALDSRYRLARHWTGLFDWRYDAGSGRTAEAGLGLEYRNECTMIELSVSRRFSTSTSVNSSTSIGLSFALLGFSVNSSDQSYTRTCGT
ncbi:LPS-assembly protein LptD [Shimia abyssi]|uniref:LPS-assembly protein LptD n=1 Tax=Shimia abyssi TaxID=1662395 RepID=A0A2P8FGA2_9RHOB|nr:LPS assembly protein LptD [Shimia abyssi]PSL20746.1 LPS-assembly protein [Shimia abyssi]